MEDGYRKESMMGWTRRNGVVLSFTLLLTLVGHYALDRRHHARIDRLVEAFTDRANHEIDLIYDDLEEQATCVLTDCSVDEPSDSASSLPGIRLSLPPRQISQVSGTDDDSSEQQTPQSVPEPIDGNTQPEEVADLQEENEPDAQPPDASAVRRVIDEEMAGSSGEERDIWYQELKSIPAGVVRDLLQVRKQLRSLPRGLHQPDSPFTSSASTSSANPSSTSTAPRRGSDVAEKPRFSEPIRVAEVTAEPVSQSYRPSSFGWSETTKAIDRAVSLSKHNIANSMTPGFKRLQWHFVDAYAESLTDVDSIHSSPTEESNLQTENSPGGIRFHDKLTHSQAEISGQGCRITTPILDLKQGTLLPTGRTLDLAIDGNGYFCVHINGVPTWSRCGTMVLNRDRQLSLLVSDSPAPLQPIVTIPDAVQEIQITAQGEVRVLVNPGADPQSVGKIELALFTSPEQLRPIGKTLLAQTEESGSPVLGEPESMGRGSLQQGFIEQSNVDVDRELSLLEELRRLMDVLPNHPRPVTAQSPSSGSR
ncbi:MAG: flagellar hook basal-body protein [Planctomycetes bacterium]|nr:flagellar hook basal-body protein [Planctomycetota bacterium]